MRTEENRESLKNIEKYVRKINTKKNEKKSKRTMFFQHFIEKINNETEIIILTTINSKLTAN